tara:strand:- start:847 stop:1128 length:282 start_codon:yes stop_codon:yes gene_type:complete
MKEYEWLNLKDVKIHEKQAREEKVSQKARSPQGFLPAFKKAHGDPEKMSTQWHSKRHGFIARTLPQYQKKKTLRRWLALVMWAYKPGDRPQVT